MTRDFDTNLGLFSFDPDGEVIFEPVIPIVKDSTVLRMDVGKLSGRGVARVQGIVSASGMSINVITDAIRGIPDTIAPQCRCGIDSTDEGDAGPSTERQKAILEQGLKLLERDANPQPDAGEGDADRVGEPPAQYQRRCLNQARPHATECVIGNFPNSKKDSLIKWMLQKFFTGFSTTGLTLSVFSSSFSLRSL